MGGNSSSVTGRLAVVIDDAGLDLESQRIYEEIGVPLTLAVMPNKMYTSEAAAEWSRYGMPVILHQPMEPVSGSGMEEKTILTSMSDEAIRYMLKESLEQIPQAVGINNHQGSRATTDARVMRVVMNELSHRGLFFLTAVPIPRLRLTARQPHMAFPMQGMIYLWIILPMKVKSGR